MIKPRKKIINKIMSFVLAVAMTVTLTPAALMSQTDEVSAATSVSAPRVTSESTTWDCVYFGSYPQTEIVANASQCGTYGNSYWGQSSDYAVNSSLYSQLQNANYNANGDTIINGAKYRRIKKSDATHGTSGISDYYNWSDSSTYHYFRYDKIKWRVLEVSNGYAMLLADKALDDQEYNTSSTGATWENCTMRSWLNGYSASANSFGTDYSSNNFIDSAFSSSEQSAIKTTNLENADNIEYGTEGGNSTNDKVFLLSESDVWNTDKAVRHGFVRASDTYAKQRRSKSSTYAKAMGTWSVTGTDHDGNCWWWLRSPGYDTSTFAVCVAYDGYVLDYGTYVYYYYNGVRPALHLNLKSGVWSSAGTMSSDEIGDEPEPEKNDGEYVNSTVSVKYNPSEDKEKSRNKNISINYKDDFFTSNNSSYNINIAKASHAVSMASMTAKYNQSGSTVKQNSNIKDLFVNKLKYTDYVSKKYDTSTSLSAKNDTCAYSIARKKVKVDGEETEILAVSIRSGVYGGEWYSNGQVRGGESDMHKGFTAAANGVKTDVLNYISAHGMNKSNVKVWISGFSRGAAISNVLGKRLIDSGISSSNMYCYTAATPTTTKNAVKVRGIYNTINSFDVIPAVPLKKWGYERYGQNIYLPSHFNASFYSDMSSVKSRFKELTPNSTKYGTYYNHILFMNELIGTLNSAVGGSDKTYYKSWQSNVSSLLYSCMGKQDGVSCDVLKLLQGVGINLSLDKFGKPNTVVCVALACIAGNASIIDLKNGESSLLLKQHWPEVYMAWLEKGRYYTSCAYKHLKVNCPVNVEVYDKNGTLAAKIVDDDFSSFMLDNEDIALEAYVDENGEKQVIIPGDADYTVKVTATDDGEMDYSVSDVDESGVQKKINYNDIDLNEGDEFQAHVPEGEDNSAEKFNLLENGTKEIEPSEVLSNDELENINVDVQIEGNGIVIGTGKYSSKDSVVLHAQPMENSTFKGWYKDGELISKDSTYGFIAETGKDVSLNAKFTTKLSSGNASISYATTAYSGKLKKPAVTVKYRGNNLIKGTDYTVTYKNNKNVGKATVTITGKGYYTGKVTKTFKINPKGTSIAKLTKAKKAFTAKWKKQSAKMSKTRITGYQIRYSTKSSMSSAKTVKVKGYAKTSKKISKLKAKKKYYVQVRTYKTVNGTKYYSSWSKKKYVKTR